MVNDKSFKKFKLIIIFNQSINQTFSGVCFAVIAVLACPASHLCRTTHAQGSADPGKMKIACGERIGLCEYFVRATTPF